ncbi:MAG: hypothetical protein JO149_01390, partial [Gammaproteobacteria bacterium]|nr:hypothetical protein [Gammaproteobacteria bacterium]
ALSAKLSNGIMAKCALASGFITATNTERTIALNAVNSGLQIIPGVPSFDSAIKTLNQNSQVESGTNVSMNIGNPVVWINYVWNELVPELMEIFEDVIAKMEGPADPERFAEYCKNRIMDKLQDGTPYPSEDNKAERIAYIVNAILMNNSLSILPRLPSYVTMNKDSSFIFLEHSCEGIAKNCQIKTIKNPSDYKTNSSKSRTDHSKSHEEKSEDSITIKQTEPVTEKTKEKTWQYYVNGKEQTSYGTLYFRNYDTAKYVKKLTHHRSEAPGTIKNKGR